nr:hypothetical protein [Arenivirga flava]
MEDRLVEPAPNLVLRDHVELLRVLEETKVGLDVAHAHLEIGLDATKLSGEALALELDLGQSRPDASLRNLGIGREIEEVLLLHVVGLELLAELSLEQALSVGLVGDRARHEVAHRSDEVGAEALRLVEVLDRVLNAQHVVVRLVAVALSPARAEEVVVLAAIAPNRPLQDETLLDTESAPAFTAVDGALEVMVVLTATLTRTTS